MSTSFSSSGNLQFSSLGLTSSVTGITVSTSLFDIVSGSTVVTSFVPSPLNYVLGSVLDQTIVGQSYQTFTRGVLSLTTNSSRIVEISLVPGLSLGFIELSNPQFQNTVSFMRVLRGPSTIIGEVEPASELTASTDAYFIRYPASSFKFTDFSPLSGAATYILQAFPTGASTQLDAMGSLMFVRQL